MLLVAGLWACGNESGSANGDPVCQRGERLVDGACVPIGPSRPGGGGGRDDAGDPGPGDPDVDATVDGQDGGGPGPDDDAGEGSGASDTGIPPNPGFLCDGPGQVPTTIRGVVRIPSGELPLPDVDVYVPLGGRVGPMEEGADCTPCGDRLSSIPQAQTTTGNDGVFNLVNAPYGENITIVTEVGRWRRVSVIPQVLPCQVNEIDPELTRLPRNQSEGNLPRFAVSTGGCDALECLLRKIGISDSEFTPEGGGGRVQLFAGTHGTRRYAPSLNGGASFRQASDWWRSLDNLLPYDIILHSCECSEATSGKPAAATQAMRDYANAGGRLFLSHYHFAWMRTGPSDFQSVATWNSQEGAMRSPLTATVDTSFLKGAQLSDWMLANGIGSARDQFELREGRASVNTLNESIATRWAWVRSECDPFVQSTFPAFCPPLREEQPIYMSFNTPIGTLPDDQCGRVVHSDIHVSGGDRSSAGTRENSGPEVFFPNGCTTTGLTDQEAVLVFMLFDLSRCVVPDKR
jgi:hypothetical protein